MHIAIDVNELCITHVHNDTRILEALVHLECTQRRHVMFVNTASPTFLSLLSTAQLNQLYCNTTGTDFPLSFDDTMRRNLIANVIEEIQVPKINAEELNSQIKIVEDELQEHLNTALQFQYVHGEQIPRILTKCLPALSAAPATVAQLKVTQQTTAQRYNAPVVPTKQIEHRSAVKISKTNEDGSPKGKSAFVIWEHANKVWEEAGRPKDRQTVLALRKVMMNNLEKQGLNRNTVSCTLGDWMKAKI